MASRRPLGISRAQVLAHRLRAGALDHRLPSGSASIRRAAWAGLQDSVPRAAVLSLHARVEDTAPDGWAHPALVQVWGPRFNTFAVPAGDLAAFTLGRLPTDGPARRRADETADLLERFLAGRRMSYRDAGKGIGIHPNGLRHAGPTGRVLLRWKGSGQPVVWTVDPPDVAEDAARLDLVRRYLHVLGPGTAAGFSKWAGVTLRTARTTFDALGDEAVAVETPTGPGRMLADDVTAALRPSADGPRTTRLLPSGDAYYLLWGTDRELLVPDSRHRDELWTSRVWPGAILVDGEIVGTWRRSSAQVDLTTWHRLTAQQRDAIAAEAAELPILGDHIAVTTSWTTP
jgi:Winged helix DNA-binding domain